MNGVYEYCRFWHIEIFCINYTLIEAVLTEVDGPKNLQEYGALNMQKKIGPEELEKGRLM